MIAFGYPAYVIRSLLCFSIFAELNFYKDSLLDPCGQGKFLDDHPVLKLIQIENRGQNHPQYIPVDSAKIDNARLVKWSAYCDRNHQGSCHDLPHWQIVPAALSLIFVDVQNSCLVQTLGRVSDKYVALSYVWGRTPGGLELRSENLSLLCVTGSLREIKFFSRIPKTILDAMKITRQMGLRYLWVDRLCIIQDIPTHLTTQLQQMASIYANCYFTIIAADGFDAEHGLHGVDPHYLARCNLQTSFDFAENVKMIQKPEKESIFYKPFWNTRGWTFQERAVSPRNLVFTNNTMYWECRSATWYENIRGEADGISSQVKPYPASLGWPSYALRINPWPDLEQYFSLVGGYNARNLTFESDALNAFAAIITAMSKSFPGGFHFGLPMFLFDIGMLWSSSSSLKRRSGFPSWSWLGWAGEVSLPFGYRDAWNPSFDYARQDVRIRPLVRWYGINKDGISRHLIDNSYYLHRVDITEPSFTAPDSWNKTWNEEYDEEAVQHEGLPNFLFKHPFPVFPPVKVDSTHSFSCFLEFEGEACTLYLGASYSDDLGLERSLKVNLLDSRGRWSGVIESLYVHEEQYGRGTPCELIAISEGWATPNEFDESDPYEVSYQPFEEMERVQDIKMLDKYPFYNVLWVDWIGGVAYRRAMGRVWKNAWRLQNVKTVSVVLG